MKTLSLLQPWASLVVSGAKKIETRSWSTAHHGDLLIHASLGRKGALLASAPHFSRFIMQFADLPFGAIIGKVTLVDIFQFGPEDLFSDEMGWLTLEDRAFGDYSPGRYG